MNKIFITGLTVYTEYGLLEQGGVLIENGLIKDILTNVVKKVSDAQTISFPANYSLIPGMIDMHIHGAGGADVMDASIEALRTITKSIAAEGTTAFLVTTITESSQCIEDSLRVVKEYVNLSEKREGAEVLGVHMEGPFLSPERKGAQRADLMVLPDINLFNKWQEISGNVVKLVTVAPELPGSLDFIRYLKKQGIIVSVGHSNATYEETAAGINAGASHATHLFNAMRGFHQREPGTAVPLLMNDNVIAELIVDGIHLHKGTVELAYKIKGGKRLVLITDSIRAKYYGNMNFELGGQKVTVKDGAARLKDGTLAGSILKMNDAVKNMISYTGCKLADTIKMTSENPARSLGVFDRKGSISKDKDADLVVLDENYGVVLTLCRGKIVYRGGL